MPTPIGQLRPYVVQVMDPLGIHVVGTGFFCHPEGVILTCWHVIKSWADKARTKGWVRFGNQQVAAEWLKDKSHEAADLAVLKLAQDNQEDHAYHYLSLDVHERSQTTDELASFGYPKGAFEKQGIPVTSHLQGLDCTPTDGVAVLPLSGFNHKDIDSGYSGAPVFNRSTQKVIGLVHGKRVDLNTQAFMIPLTPLFSTWPELRAYHDVFEHIRQYLGQQAQEAYRAHLHAAPFIPIKFVAGRIERNEQKGQGKASEEAGQDGRKWERVDVNELMPLRGKFILSADVGTGKTTFVHWVASELVRNTEITPIVLSCQTLEPWVLRTSEEAQSGIRSTIASQLKNKFLPKDVEHALCAAKDNGTLVFLFDGLDQIRGEHPSDVVQLAQSVAGQGPILITSRPSAINSSLEKDEQLIFLCPQPFSISDQRLYFGMHYKTAKAVCALAPDLTRVPMLAYMVRELILKCHLKRSSTRTELYEAFLAHVVTDHGANVRLQDKPGLVGKVEPSLGKLAFEALARARPHIQRVPSKMYVGEVPLEDLIAFGLVNRLIDRGKEALLFTHQSFQEFLAAKHAVDHPEGEGQIYEERWHPKWAGVIKFLVGLKGEDLIQQILKEPDDVIYSDLFLAAGCVREAKTVSTELRVDLGKRLTALCETEPFDSHARGALVAMSRWLENAQIQWLTGQLGNNHPAARREALRVIGGLSERVEPATVMAIVGLLQDEDYGVREAAVRALGELGERVDTGTVTAIVGRLQDADPDVRKAAVRALGELGERVDEGTVTAIAGLLQAEDYGVREAAIRVLGELGERMEGEAVSAMAGRLQDADPKVRAAVVTVFGGLGERVDKVILTEIVGRLQDADPKVREATVRALRQLSERMEGEAGTAMAGLLQDANPDVREAAVRAFLMLGEGVEVATVTAMAGLLQDANPDVREAAVRALGQLSERIDGETVIAITGLFQDGTWRVREAAVRALGELGERVDTGTVTAITGLLDHESCFMREVALRALGKLGRRMDGGTVAAIVGRLQDADPDVREAAVRALGRMGERVDRGTVAAVVGRLQDAHPDVREAAAMVLGELGGRMDGGTVNAIADLFQDADTNTREAAVRAFVRLSERVDKGTVTAIAGLLQAEDYRVREAAVKALGRLGERVDRETVTAIVGRFQDEDYRVRATAIAVLAELSQPMDSGIVTAIVGLLQDRSWSVRRAAVTMLGKLGEQVEATTITAIVGRLQDADPDVREAAVRALGELGERVDRGTVTAIVGLLQAEDYRVREAAVRALGQLSERVDEGTVTAIAGLLQAEDYRLREAVAKTLGGLGQRVDPLTVRKLADLQVSGDFFTDKVAEVANDALWNLYRSGTALPQNKLK
ncbi:hypothetical protein YTPLAS72_27330 [Nitrospira sp.]|nr:hypothetical protein YTPLAS72_27330 [Nitrospira sp.]